MAISVLEVGVIGVGNHVRQVLMPAIEQVPDVMRVAALATAHEETAAAAGEFYRLPCHVGYEALIADPNVKAVIVASNTDHERQAIAALEAGKPVFTETPGITSRAGADRIRSLLKKTGLTYAVGSCLRHAPPYQRLRTMLQDWREAEPGPRTINASYYFAGGHFHNLLLFLNGTISEVLSIPSSDNAASLTLIRFANGDIGSIRACGYHNLAPPCEQVEITHPTGLLAADEGRLLRFHRSPDTGTSVMDFSFSCVDGQLIQPTHSIAYGENRDLYMRGYIPELKDFANCVRTGSQPVCGLDDALETLLVGQAAQRSVAAGGEWTEVGSGGSGDAVNTSA